MLNVRAHAIRATGRLVALVVARRRGIPDTAGRSRARSTRFPRSRGSRPSAWICWSACGGLGGLQIAAALVLGLFLTGAYGAGDRRRSAKSILVGCAVATLLQLWSGLWTSPGLVALQILFGAALLGAAVLTGRL